jgi:hypothetical protein
VHSLDLQLAGLKPRLFPHQHEKRTHISADSDHLTGVSSQSAGLSISKIVTGAESRALELSHVTVITKGAGL